MAQRLAVAAAGGGGDRGRSALQGLDREPRHLWGYPDAAASTGYHAQVQSGCGLEHARQRLGLAAVAVFRAGRRGRCGTGLLAATARRARAEALVLEPGPD